MYSKEQSSAIKQEFWTAFGQYMALTRNADGERVNWINYKTGIKHMHIKMQADHKSAYLAIEISHSEPGIQELFFEQFQEYKKILHEMLHEEWSWELHVSNEYNKTITRIYTNLYGVNIFKKEDWPTLISFFKQRMIILDEFWSNAQHQFEIFK